MNSVFLMGRLVFEPELKKTSSGISALTVRIAVDRPYIELTGERKADFIDVVAWRGTADFISNYFHKGYLILLQCYLHQTGDKLEVYVDRAYFCDSGKKASDGFQEVSASDGDLPFE